MKNRSDKITAEKALGKPSKINQSKDKVEWIYSVPYKKQLIPEVRIVFDREGLVTEKHINLLYESVNIEKFKNYFDAKDFVVKFPDQWGKTHFFSPDRYLVSKEHGISIMYNESRNDEVYSVSWYIPNSGRETANSKK